jgi:UDP-N-acetylmuramoylalanine--D-glutamate ligase
MNPMRFSGQTILVLGLGKSGLAAARLLSSQGASVIGADHRPLADLPAVNNSVENSEIFFVPESEVNLSGLSRLVVSPGVPLDRPLLLEARRRGIPILGEVELAFEFLRGPIIAITGSNGKTTTTALTGHILQQAGIDSQVGGNIGLAVTAMIDSSRFTRWNVLELSSFQLETVDRFHAQIAAILNVTPNHLDRHGTFDAYAAAKGNIFRNQRAADWAVLNAANPASAAYAPSTPASIARFCGESASVHDGKIEVFGQTLMPLSDIPLPGAHNQQNVMAAALISSLAGASHSAIAGAVSTFRGVPHRLEFIRELRGVRFYNDSKATSVDATLKALEALPGPLWVILGGLGKGASYAPLLPQLRAKAKAALLIGAAAADIARDLEGHLPLEHSLTLDNALASAFRQARPGDTVLLAPACASFDQFLSFEHRGDSFRQLVENL